MLKGDDVGGGACGRVVNGFEERNGFENFGRRVKVMCERERLGRGAFIRRKTSPK